MHVKRAAIKAAYGLKFANYFLNLEKILQNVCLKLCAPRACHFVLQLPCCLAK